MLRYAIKLFNVLLITGVLGAVAAKSSYAAEDDDGDGSATRWKCHPSQQGCIVGARNYCHAECGETCKCVTWDAVALKSDQRSELGKLYSVVPRGLVGAPAESADA